MFNLRLGAAVAALALMLLSGGCTGTRGLAPTSNAYDRGLAPTSNAYDDWQHKQYNPAWQSPWPIDGRGRWEDWPSW